ncbi:MAG: hypothetical protein AB4038_01335 [Prochloraceae cyanobacterium]
MTEESNAPKETAIVEVSPETKALVEKEMPEASQLIKNETMALIEAIKTKAQSETQKAGEFTREKYLEAVRSVRADIEKLEFKPEKIEESFKLIQEEAEKNWDSLAKQVSDLGDRLSEAAQAAWQKLTAPRSKEDKEDS